jgi:hypothetical protein
MSHPYDDFIKGMPLAELERFVADLSRQYGVTDAEMDEWQRLSHAERRQRLDALIAQMRRDLEGGNA